MDVVTLWRPVGPAELALIEASDLTEFPPRLPDQPIFYPVTSEDYAVKIARDWNVPASGSGFVTCFDVRKDFLDLYRVPGAPRILDSVRGFTGIQRSDRRTDQGRSILS